MTEEQKQFKAYIEMMWYPCHQEETLRGRRQ